MKLNVVVMRGVNDDELVDFAAFGRDKGVQVRFIEFMPLDAQQAWTNEQVVTQDEIVGRASPRPSRSRRCPSRSAARPPPPGGATSTAAARSA